MPRHMPLAPTKASSAAPPEHALARTTPFPNALLDRLLPTLRDTEWRLLCVIVRQTRGWLTGNGRRKTRDWFTQSQLMARTGRRSEAVSKAVDSLVRQGLIEVQDQEGKPLPTPQERRRYAGHLYYKLAPRATAADDATGIATAKSEASCSPSEVRLAKTTKANGTKYLSKDRARRDGGPCGKLEAAARNRGTAQQRNPQVKRFLCDYRERFQRRSARGEYPPIAWGRDGKIVRELLKLYSYERLSDLLEQFFGNQDAWLKKRGYSLAAFRDALPSLLLGNFPDKPHRPAIRTGQWTAAGQVMPCGSKGRKPSRQV